jgi:hypothetical protein
MVAGSTTSGVTYAWSGPNGLASSTSSITANAAGNYTVMLTNPVNGCTNNTTVQVTQNTTPPAAVAATTASGSNQITCANGSQTLSGSSSTAGVSYAWTGPNGYSASTATAIASAAGSYMLTVTNPVNGCTAAASVALQQNTSLPTGVTATAASPGQITCNNTSVALTGSSTTSGVSYHWSSPNGFSASTANTTVQAAGSYTLTVTDNSNGCTASSIATVTLNNAAPLGVSAFVSDQLTCNVQSVNLNGSSTTPGATYKWVGLNFEVLSANTSTTVPGTYLFTAINPANGCIKTIPVLVSQNIAPPANVIVSNSGPLTCTLTEVTITGSSSSPNVEYQWDGPDGYLSFSAEDIASEPGDYMLTVTNSDNGCAVQATTTVVQTCNAERRTTGGADDSTSTVAAKATTAGAVFEYKAYPNPFRDKAVVEFKLPESTFVTVQVYNSNGIMEKLLYNDKAIAGRLYKLDLSGRLPAGMHYVVIRTSNRVYTKQLISIQ